MDTYCIQCDNVSGVVYRVNITDNKNWLYVHQRFYCSYGWAVKLVIV